jgi:putative phosphoribosyl transferase
MAMLHADRARGDDDDEYVSLPFTDRATAGAQLARRLTAYEGRNTLVLGIARGGTEVAAEVARALGAELDVAVARKLGAPFHPELAIGAITADGTRFVDPELCEQLGVTRGYLQEVEQREIAEARRRESRFRGSRPDPAIAGRRRRG